MKTTLYTNVRNNAQSNYHHDRFGKQKGGVTIAWREMGDHIVYAFASCSDKDMFNKKTGRDLCDNRLNSVSVTEDGIQYPDNMDPYILCLSLDQIAGILYEFDMIGSVTKKKAKEILDDLELSDISFSTYINIFKIVNSIL